MAASGEGDRPVSGGSEEELLDLRTRLSAQSAELLDLRARLDSTQEDLRESEIRFRTILDSAGIGIGIDELTGRTILCNPALERILGYSEAELRDMVYPAFTHPLDIQGELTLHQDLLEGRADLYRYEKRFVRKSGDVIWGRLTVSLLRRPDEAPTGLVVMVEDISERKRTEMALRQSEERWRSLAENTPDIILTADPTGRIRYANRAFEGIAAPQLIGRKIHDCVLLEHRDEMRAALQTALASRNLVRLEFSSVDNGGRLAWFSAGITPVVVENEVTAATVVVTDISDRKRMEDELRDYARRLEREVSDRTRKLRVLYAVTDLTTAPPDLESMLRASLGEIRATMPGNAVSFQMLRGDTPGAGPVLVIQQGLPGQIVEQLAEGLSGAGPWSAVAHQEAPVCIEARASEAAGLCPPGFGAYVGVPIRAGGETRGVLSTFCAHESRPEADDIELLAAVADQLGRAVERIDLRKQADQAIVAEERQRLARDLHDSITQLMCSQALLAHASREFIENGCVDEARPYLAQLVETAHHALKEMRLMIYDLRPSELEREGLEAALAHRLDAVEHRAGIQASLSGSLSRPLERRTEEGLYRIAQELLNNVLKHARASTVHVRLSEGAVGPVLEVVDDGQGFDPRGPSAGIGLKSVEERVRALGGVLSISSRPGSGTRVGVELPGHHGTAASARP